MECALSSTGLWSYLLNVQELKVRKADGNFA